eukprot:PhF_6_TR459/c0_g1_i1/m.184
MQRERLLLPPVHVKQSNKKTSPSWSKQVKSPAASRQLKSTLRLALPALPKFQMTDSELYLEFIVIDESEQRRLKCKKCMKLLIDIGIRNQETLQRKYLIEQWAQTWALSLQQMFSEEVYSWIAENEKEETFSRSQILFLCEDSHRNVILNEFATVTKETLRPNAELVRGISAETFRYRREVIGEKLDKLPFEEDDERMTYFMEEIAIRIDFCLSAEMNARYVREINESEYRKQIESDSFHRGTQREYSKIMETKWTMATDFLSLCFDSSRHYWTDLWKVQADNLWATILGFEEPMRRNRIALEEIEIREHMLSSTYQKDYLSWFETWSRTTVLLDEAIAFDVMFRESVYLLEEEETDGYIKMHRFVLLSAHFDLNQLTEHGADLAEFLRLTGSIDSMSVQDDDAAQHELNRHLQLKTISAKSSRAVRTSQIQAISYVEHLSRSEDWNSYVNSVITFLRAMESEMRVLLVGDAISTLFTILESHRKAIRHLKK